MRALSSDRGEVRMFTLTWVVVVLAIIGVFGYDGFSIMATHVNTENDAQDAAYAASQAWHTNPDLQDAYDAAVAAVAGKGDTVLTTNFTVDSDGTIHLLVQHTARTIVFSRIGALKHLTVVTEHGDANSVN